MYIYKGFLLLYGSMKVFKAPCKWLLLTPSEGHGVLQGRGAPLHGGDTKSTSTKYKWCGLSQL